MSQSDIEKRFFDSVDRIRRGETTPDQAFADESDWSLDLGERRFLLHPGMVRWLVYDPLHDDWYDTGYGPGEALLVADGRQAGALRLPAPPQPGAPATAAEWCLLVDAGRSLGVRQAEEVRRAQAEGSLPAGVRVWDGASGRWHTIESFAGPAGTPPPEAVTPSEAVTLSEAKGPVAPPPQAAGQEPRDPVTPPEPVTLSEAKGLVAPPPQAAGQLPPTPIKRPAFCSQCGARLGPQARFCGSCGQPVN